LGSINPPAPAKGIVRQDDVAVTMFVVTLAFYEWVVTFRVV